ncbi:Importin alpha subunit (Karyopherin alpha subunit) (Serine-rich RNA polymerase I suppressor protein) [Tulasnella sp. 417]|nr:Importin alpha subunit (Karyopherin alpha subunit) (Serine-rich RNA polymerase I suppressor protein) [Tulasnella sp. 417]
MARREGRKGHPRLVMLRAAVRTAFDVYIGKPQGSTLRSQLEYEMEVKEESDDEMRAPTEGDSDNIEPMCYITDDLLIIPEIVSEIHSTDQKVQLVGALKIRRLIQALPEKARQAVISSGLLEAVVEMLSSDDLELRGEAAWILAEIAAGTLGQATAVAAAGAIPKLVALFPSKSTASACNALRALGHIGSVSKRLRNLVAQEGGVKPVLDVLDVPEKHASELVDMASWALARYLNARHLNAHLLIPNISDPPGYEFTQQMIPVVIKLIENTTDENSNALTSAVEALHYMSFDDSAVDAIFATGIAPRLIELCAAKNSDLRYRAIQFFGRFADGKDTWLNASIQLGYLAVLKSCIESRDLDTQRDACWTASNIAAGNSAEALLDHNLIPSILHIISDQEEPPRSREGASWVLSHLSLKCKQRDDLLVRLVQANCVEALVSGLASHSYDTRGLLLRAIENITTKEWSGQGRFWNVLKWQVESGDLLRSEIGNSLVNGGPDTWLQGS